MGCLISKPTPAIESEIKNNKCCIDDDCRCKFICCVVIQSNKKVNNVDTSVS